ncbi:hypothetical protein [Modestobacter sp. Leaf380]|uniref:hypothetical protein n=1 Tax=Modestobacter sp. Leaf380 TaxID=1736356 RepID=UPI0012F80F79|nr:hypothetical protein [Modestobacter sp. Leaf380]
MTTSPRPLAVPMLTLLLLLTSACSSDSLPDSPAQHDSADDDSVSIEQQQQELAAGFGISDPPPVEVIRLVTPEDRQQLVADCLLEQGFDTAEIIDSGLPSDQVAAYNLAEYVCAASYPINPDFMGAYTDRQISIQYDWTVDSVIPCLRAEGYTISDPPSREVFIETYTTDPFYPFAELFDLQLSNAEWNALEVRCPQIAPTNLLFPDAN